jgi:hypothetical protein
VSRTTLYQESETHSIYPITGFACGRFQLLGSTSQSSITPPNHPNQLHPSGTPFPIRLKREDRSNSRHKNIQRRTNVNWHGCASLSQHVSIACSIKTLQRCQKLTSATVAITALNIPMIRFHPIAMPLPVPRCALGSTSGVYAYNVP